MFDPRLRGNRHPWPVGSTILAVMTRALTLPVARAAAAIRRIVGAPDYERYVEHVRRCHPGVAPLAREAYLRDALARRYDRPGSRCC
jgi:uncharacterized short protein YbdD (DUF466 family)